MEGNLECATAPVVVGLVLKCRKTILTAEKHLQGLILSFNGDSGGFRG